MTQEALEIEYSHLDSSSCDSMVLRSDVSPLQEHKSVSQTWGTDAAIGTAFGKTAMVELEVYDTGFPVGGATVLSSRTRALSDLPLASLAFDMTQNFRQIGL